MDAEDDTQRAAVGETSPLLRRQEAQELSMKYKILRTILLFLLWLCIGCFSEITGPVLPELVVQTHSNYDLVAQCLSMRGAGHALGGIIGGLSVDRTLAYVDILMAGVLLLYTLVSVGAAYVQSITLLYIVMTAQGSLETYLQISGYRIAFRTWRGKAAGPLHALHMGYGLGSIIIPEFVAPFLDPRFSSGAVQTGYNSSCRVNETSHDSTTITPTSTTSMYLANQYSTNSTGTEGPIPKYPAHFVTAYWILSGLSLSMSAIFLSYHIHGRVTGIRLDDRSKKQETSHLSYLKKSLSPRSCSPTKPVYAALIVGSLFFHYSISVPMARAFSKFIFSYARDGPCLSVTESTSLESVYFAALTVGRLCAFLSSSVINIKYLLQIEVLGVFASCLTLFFLYENVTVLWAVFCALGFFTGPVIPTAYAWANRYIEITSVAQIIPQLGAAGGDVIFLVMLGYSYQNFGPYVLWTYELFLCSGICVVAWIMQIFGSLHGDRYEVKKPDNDIQEEESR